MRVTDLLPSRTDYDLRPRSLRPDLVAGLTVGIVALPLALAFGASAGVGPAAGLVTAVVAGVVAAVFGGSNVQVSGPTGAMAVVLAPIVVEHGAGAISLVSVLAGLVVVAAGLLRLGRVVVLLPWPVVEGFTLGIAAIIALQQVPTALGIRVESGHDTLRTAVDAVSRVFVGVDLSSTLWTVGTAAVVIAGMSVLPRLHTVIPASLVMLAVVTVLAEVLGLPIARIGELPSSLPTPVLPSVDLATMRDLGGAALAVAVLAAIESLLSARVASSMTRLAYQPDRELVGQGLASVASGFFGGMPATGAIARTAVNVRSGARTRLAAIVHALVVLAVLYLATGPVSKVPLAALAGVLLATSARMISLATVRAVFGAGRGAALTFAVTAMVTITLDLVQAIEVGLVVSAVLALWHLARATTAQREPLPGPAAVGDDRIALFRLEGAVFFGAAERILETIASRADVDGVDVVILRLSGVGLLDATGARAGRADREAGGLREDRPGEGCSAGSSPHPRRSRRDRRPPPPDPRRPNPRGRRRARAPARPAGSLSRRVRAVLLRRADRSRPIRERLGARVRQVTVRPSAPAAAVSTVSVRVRDPVYGDPYPTEKVGAASSPRTTRSEVRDTSG